MRIAFLPTPPMMIPEIATGASAELDRVRRMARVAVNWACEDATSIGVLVPETTPAKSLTWSLRGFGVRVGDGTPVGLEEGIARWLLDGRAADVVGVDGGPGALSGFDALLVMGDGSASRTEKAPAHRHADSHAFDQAVLTAIENGDPSALAGVDIAGAEAVVAAGAPAWVYLGQGLAEVTSSHLDIQQDPFGVLYFVARWTGRWAHPT